MRELTDSERKVRTKKYLEYEKSSKEALTIGEKWAFDAGNAAGLDHAADQLAALTTERDSLRDVLKEIAAVKPQGLLARWLVNRARRALDNQINSTRTGDTNNE